MEKKKPDIFCEKIKKIQPYDTPGIVDTIEKSKPRKIKENRGFAQKFFQKSRKKV